MDSFLAGAASVLGAAFWNRADLQIKEGMGRIGYALGWFVGWLVDKSKSRSIRGRH
jgi:hypothetical protein